MKNLQLVIVDEHIDNPAVCLAVLAFSLKLS